jgi:hypothetical protein
MRCGRSGASRTSSLSGSDLAQEEPAALATAEAVAPAIEDLEEGALKIRSVSILKPAVALAVLALSQGPSWAQG